MSITRRVLQESEIDDELDQKIQEAYSRCFPSWSESKGATRYWNSAPSWVIVLEEDQKLIGHTAIVDRTIRIGSRPVRVAGVQGVCVLPGYRGQGHCRRLLEVAREFSLAREFELMILFCGHQLEPVYAASEFRCIDGSAVRLGNKLARRLGFGNRSFGTRVIRIDERGEERAMLDHGTLMWRPLTLDRLPRGLVRLEGNDW